MIAKKDTLPQLDLAVDPDSALMEVHSTYQKVDFTEENVELMCREANILMRLVPPQCLSLYPSSLV